MSAAAARGPVDEVTHWLVGELVAPDGARRSLDVDLLWRRADPVAVELRFVAAGVTWFVGRELLGEGMVRPAGRGDVQVQPTVEDGGVVLELASPSGCARVWLAAGEVCEFLASTYQVVGPDEASEIVQVQLEAELAVLLAQAGGVA